MATRLVLIHALSPLHAGTGQAVGAIDLPIARERPTGIPLVPGSSIKGALRARSEKGGHRTVAAFGPETANASDHAGAIQVGDAHLVLLPVRSLAGTFAWVTSPYLLHRFSRDAREAGFDLPRAPAPGTALECLLLGSRILAQGRVVLEDLELKVSPNAQEPVLTAYARVLARAFGEASEELQTLRDRLCVVHDDVMSFLLDTATEVTARVRLDEDKKTVAKGALWYEEALPTESVLCGVLLASTVSRKGQTYTADELADFVSQLPGTALQLGGKANVGRGTCRVSLVQEQATPPAKKEAA